MENLLIMLSLLTLVSCSLPSPKNGDLVFVVGSESEMSEAITDATSGEADALSFYKSWESMVSWMLYDAGVTKFSPSDFGIEK